MKSVIKMFLGFIILIIGVFVSFLFLDYLKNGGLDKITDKIGEYVLFLVMFLPYIVIYLKTLFEANKELTGGKDEI